MTLAVCHPERPAYRRQPVCQPCYRVAVRETKTPACHPDRAYYAAGLCSGCYFRQKRRSECHPERPFRARGLCGTCYQKVYRADKDRVAARVRLLRAYGLTLEDYDALFILQAGACAICHQESDRPLAVDHDHETGRVRGLLCTLCNRAIGNLRDDPTLARRLADYLERDSRTEYGTDALLEAAR